MVVRSSVAEAELPDDPIVVIDTGAGHPYLHQLLACDPTLATARNSLTMAPQVRCCSNL